MRLLLRGRNLLQLGKGSANAHRLSLDSRMSYTTIEKYTKRPETVSALDLKTISALLVDGLGFTPDEVLDLRLGDLFEWKDD